MHCNENICFKSIYSNKKEKKGLKDLEEGMTSGPAIAIGLIKKKCMHNFQNYIMWRTAYGHFIHFTCKPHHKHGSNQSQALDQKTLPYYKGYLAVFINLIS